MATNRRHQKWRPRRDDGRCANTAHHREPQTKRESHQFTQWCPGTQVSGAAIRYVQPAVPRLCVGRRDVFVAWPGHRGGAVVHIASCA